jgi:hypothetical protein
MGSFYPPLLIECCAQQVFSVATTRAHDGNLSRDLMSLLDEAGIRYSDGSVGYMVDPGADTSLLIDHVVAILGAAGGLGGTAAILKAFFGRHKGTTVKFGEHGQVLEADGLSVDDIIRLLEACDQRKRHPGVVEAESPEPRPPRRPTLERAILADTTAVRSTRRPVSDPWEVVFGEDGVWWWQKVTVIAWWQDDQGRDIAQITWFMSGQRWCDTFVAYAPRMRPSPGKPPTWTPWR